MSLLPTPSISEGNNVSVEFGKDYYVCPPMSRAMWANFAGYLVEDLVSLVLPLSAKRNRNSRGCDYVDEDLRIALEVVEDRFSGYTRRRDLEREVVKKLQPYLDRGFNCFYVFANGYERKDFLDVCSYLNPIGIKVISLDPIPRWEADGEFQCAKREVDEWMYRNLQRFQDKLQREILKIHPPKGSTSPPSPPLIEIGRPYTCVPRI
jgi:hypothetical protein